MWRKAASGDARRGAWDATTRLAGGLLCVAGVGAWLFWFAWRASSSPFGLTSVAVGLLELTAFVVSIVLGVALWSRPRPTPPRSPGLVVPDVVAVLLGLDDVRSVPMHGADDTGEVARARRALRVLDPRSRPSRSSAAWALVAVEGIRRMAFVALLVAVLLTGRVPFDMPPISTLMALIGAQLLFAVGHWMLSGGALRPGVRMRWSMA